MTFEQMKKEYNDRYNTEAYANDTDNQNMLQMFEKAESLSDAAKTEFVKGFDFSFALNGEMYLGGKRTAAAKLPHLLAEGPLVGIKILIR